MKVEKMQDSRISEIRSEAEALRHAIWGKRTEVWGARDITRQEFIRESPRLIIRHLLGMDLQFPISIPTGAKGPAKPAGLLDRERGLIALRSDLPLPVSRFTMGHEIGHAQLHTGMTFHRDNPLNGAELRSYNRSPIEAEADRFSAELLMPSDDVRDIFLAAWGHPIAERTQSLATLLSDGCGHRITKIELQEREGLYCAMQVANSTCTPRSNSVVPMCKFFQVSTTAMGIRLIELGLIQ